MELLGTSLRMSSSFHPQTDGQTERQNRTLEQTIRNYINVKQNDWDEHLVGAELAYNNQRHSSTKYTPSQLVYGQHPNLPLDIITRSTTTKSVNPTAVNTINRWNRMIESAKNNLKEAQENQRKYANQHRRDVQLEVGEKVWVSTENIRSNIKEQIPKLTQKYMGPFEVKEVINPVNYKIDLPASLKINPNIHISKLKQHHPTTTIPHKNNHTRPTPIVSHQGEEQYWIEKIIDKRMVRRGRKEVVEWLVKWEGFPVSEATWEREDKPNQELIDDYNEGLRCNMLVVMSEMIGVC